MDKKKLRMWQERLQRNETAYSGKEAQMDARERMYRGESRIRPLVRDARKTETPHVRNICAELIEAQVDAAIPSPKVTPVHPEDERLAKIVEDMLRNELDRLPMEEINDMAARTAPIQGGVGYLLEWDNTERTHTTVGELAITCMHPKKIVPQDGVYTGIEDMDYIFLKVPQTKDYIQKRYGVDVTDAGEEEPDIKTAAGAAPADDMVTQYIAYYRNKAGGIGLYSWVRDTELEDMEDYQARRRRVCKKCGAPEPADGQDTENGGALRWIEETLVPQEMAKEKGGKRCPYCGSENWEESDEDFEELWQPVRRSDGTEIPGAQVQIIMQEDGAEIQELAPTRIPYYKPDIYPIILQKNVSVYGEFLGGSDIDVIESQQNTTNRMEAKIIDKLLQSGSYITLPDDAKIRVDENDMKVIRLGSIDKKGMIGVYDLQGDIDQDVAYLGYVYEEARQLIGITDSFQGRSDRTATSGKAKEFAAAQSAGRLESKRVMKNAAFSKLFEAIFKFKLAYTDEPRPVMTEDVHGERLFEEFNRYDFLKQDAAGEWYWEDSFLFSVDTASPLAANREAMWQETRMNLQTGAFGDPAQMQTLLLFWQKMAMLHYPGAEETKKAIQEQIQAQQEAAQRQAQMQAQMQLQQAGTQQVQQGGLDAQTMQAVLNQARQDAARDAGL